MKYDSVGPYTGIEFDATREVKAAGAVRHFRIVAYEAYNALGLIGPERNGIAVLDDDHDQVVTDDMKCADSGYFGLRPEVLEKARRLATCPDAEFIEAVECSGRLRSRDWLEGRY